MATRHHGRSIPPTWINTVLSPLATIGLLAFFSLGLTGCRVAEETARLPGQMVTAVVPGTKSKTPDPAVLQTELMRAADDFSSRTAAGLNEYARQAGNPAAHSQALTWKLSLNSSVMGIATGPNPTANLLDYLSLVGMTRAFLEANAPTVVPAGAFDHWLESSRVLESNAWNLAEATFTPSQQAELRVIMRQSSETNNQGGVTFFERPQQFAALIRQAGEKSAKPGSVFGLVGLDPTAGLDPAVREVTRTRLFAERAMYTFQRIPFLVRWQVELLSSQWFQQTAVTDALDSVARVSRAVESASQTAAQLPDRLTAERKAILAALEQQEGRLRELSAEVTRTLVAGERMSTSLNTTLMTFDTLMKRFGVGEPTAAPPDTNSPPFNILDYAKTAEQIAVMAQQLDALLKDANGTLDSPALDKRISSLQAVADHARADAKSVLNHAFLLAAGLVLLAFICAVTYRRLGARSTR